MADGSNLLAPMPLTPTSLKAPGSQTQASGRNPYLDMVVKRPQLTMPTTGGEERTLGERLRLNFEEGKRQTIGGAAESVVFDPRNEKQVDLDNPGSVADHLRGTMIRDKEASWNAMRPARTPAEIAVGLGGFIAGTAMSPETFVGPGTKFVAKGATALMRVLRAGVAGGAVNAAIDPVIQGLRMKAGLQDKYSPTQTALAGLLGLALPAALQGGMEVLTPHVGPGIPEPRQPARQTPAEALNAPPRAATAAEPPRAPDQPPADIILPETVVEADPVKVEDITKANQPENIADIGKAGSAVVDNMYDILWKKVQVGDTTENGAQSTFLQVAKAIRQRGGLQAQDDLRRMAQDYGAVDPKAPPAERQAAFNNIVQKYTPAEPPRADQIQAGPPPEIAPDLEGALPPAPARQPEATGPAPISGFHGTNAQFDTFDNAAITTEGTLGRGFYFTESQDEARLYGDRVIAADITLRNPASIEDIRRIGADTSKLQKAGFDGIDFVDDKGKRTIVAFSADQIRQKQAPVSPATATVREAVAAAREPTPVPEFTPDVSVKTPPTPGERAGTFQFDAKDLNIDAQTFQFKSEGDVEGVTPILRGVTKWDENAAGQVMLWQRRDGTLFVADGHQRIGLAKRLLASGDEQNIKVIGALYREADGFTADDVMVKAALKNIKEGSGGIVDAAKVLRKRPDLIKEIDEIGRAQTRQAVALTKVSDDVWRMVINDVIEARDAAIIGRIIPGDPVMQEAAAKALVRMKPANESEAEILVRRVQQSELIKTEDAAQGSLLGDFESPESTVAEEVRIVSRVIKTLSTDKNIMKRVAANAAQIERVGSTIARQETLSAADESGALARIVESVAFSKGEVRDALLQLAKDLKNGSKGIGQAVDDFIVALRRAETVASKRSGPTGAGGRPEAIGGQDEAGPGLFGSKPERVAPDIQPQDVSATPPIKVASGDLLRSESGRELAPVPELDFSTEAKTRNSLKRIDGWLVKEAIKEAKESGNDFVLTQMRSLDAKALSPADRDAVNLVVFGNAEGATKRSVVQTGERPMLPPADRPSALSPEDIAAVQGYNYARAQPDVTDKHLTVEAQTRFGTEPERAAFISAFKKVGKTASGGERPMLPPTTEPGADGKPQLVLPGAERVSDATLAQRRANEPMRPRAVQKREAGPLFDDGSKQLDLIDMVRMTEGKGVKELPFSQQLRGTPLRGETGRVSTGVPVASATPQAERLRTISDQVAETLGIPVRQGRIQTKKALGIYKPTEGVVRLKELDAFDVLAHEGGHALHLLPENKPFIDTLIDVHSVEVERLTYSGAPSGTEREEGFAEWFRLWMTNPGYAQREAPGFTDAMEEWLRVNRPKVDSELRSAQAAYRDWLQAPSKDVLTGDLVSSGAPPILTRIGRTLETDRTPSGESLMSLAGRFYTWTLDRLHPVNRSVKALLQINKRNTGVSLDLPAASDPYKLLRLAASAHQAGHIDLIQGVVPYRRLDPDGPSVTEALELAIGKNWFGNWRSDEMIDFGGYLVARRSIVEFERFLTGEVPNPPGKLTLGDYRQAMADYEAAFPNFRAAAEMIYEWNRNLLQKKYDAGLISLSYFEKAMDKPDYVPLRRDFSEKAEELIVAAGAGGTNRQNIMKQYRGSLRSVINPIESMMSEAYSVAAIIARNDAIAALADLAVKAGPGGGAIAEHIPTKQLTPFKVDVLDALKKAGKDAGLDRAEIDDLILAASERLDSEDVIATLFRAGDMQEKGEPIIYYWRGGERRAIRVADRRFGKDLYEAVTSIGTEQSNWVINMLAVPARGLRMGITTSPEFLLANYLRDQIAAAVLNTKFVPFASGARGMVDEIAQTRAARLYAQAGGIMGGANVASLDQAKIGREISALAKKGFSIQRLKDPRELLKLTEISETGTRIALFREYFNAAKKQGLSEYEAMVEAAFQARDFMDFGRHGSKMLFARRVVTFLNAALQGSDKTARVLFTDLAPMAKVFRGEAMTAGEKAIVNRSAAAWLKISALTALSATYALLYKDDPEWQQASEYLRATHWLFKLPGGNWAALPKPFEMATFMNFGERMAEGISSDDPTWASKWLRSWSYTLAVPLDPAGLMVPAEIAFNYDTFRERPIVQQWDLGLEPWQQFYDYTSEFSKVVGKAINVSPAKIDHLLVGWGGSWARNALAASNAIFDPQRRSDALYDWPVSGRFIKNLARGSDATDKFYGLVAETSGRLERKNNAYGHMLDGGQDDEAAKFYGSLKDDEKVWVSLNQLRSADEKRIHPLRRASDILRVYSGMRKDIASRNVVSILSKRKLDVNATVASEINDQLNRAATAETRNAMIVVGEPGWANRQIMDTAPYLKAIRMLSPAVADEIDDRMRKAKILPFEGVRMVWPELRDRLLKDGKDAFVLDLRADAMSHLDRSEAPWRKPVIARDQLGVPTTVRTGKKVGHVIRGSDGRISQVIDQNGRMMAEISRRNDSGRATRVRTGIRERNVMRGQDQRAQQLA